MGGDRRTFLKLALAAGSLAEGTRVAEAGEAPVAPAKVAWRRIATEEAFATPAQMEAMGALGRSTWNNPDLALWRSFTGSRGERMRLRRALLDITDERLADMDANGVDMHVLSLTSPGVQMFDAETAVRIAAEANDFLAGIIERHPGRFAGLAAFAPQDPAAAVREMERAVRELKLNGFILNSHTNNEYLDNPKYFPILEAAEALDRPIYIHPRCPSDLLVEGCREYGMTSGMWGFYAETSLHATRMLLSGVFDRFPRLKIVLGHMGEGLPYWLWRIGNIYDAFHPPGSATRLRTPPVEAFRRNFVITTSGVNDPDVLTYVIAKLGVENVMWAIDYPYERTAPAVRFMDSAPIPDADRRRIYQANAERVFHIGG
ncbi:MAG: amidohydrolase family protein [Pseudomonadota bacterium]|jgi:Predicted metal-dependent hydrolase of the TIM-barrel fold|nr:MAG: hydrolase [Pseudomonadota bacterium]